MAATGAIITFKASIYDPNTVGVYVVTITYLWNQFPASSSTITVTLVDPCIAGVVFPASITNKSSYLSDAKT